MAKIIQSLDPIDVGFDPRTAKTPVVLEGEPLDDYAITYTTQPGVAGERRTVRGSRRIVVARLRAMGYTVVEGERCGSCEHFDPCFINERGDAHCELLATGRVNERQSCAFLPPKHVTRVPIAPMPLRKST